MNNVKDRVFEMRDTLYYELPCILQNHEDFSRYNYVFYITMIPYLPNNINRYDFYYTAITLTTGYKCAYNDWPNDVNTITGPLVVDRD